MSSPSFASSDEVFDYLMGFVNVEKGQKTEFKLDRMADLAARLGNPERAYPTLHVAGSKGKGSVSAMVARILEAAGRACGLYTSPHLLRWKERISLSGSEIEEAVLIRAMETLLPLVEGRGPGDFVGDELPTYFELTTLVGFLAFRDLGCDAAVIETGLGGRLDSTNIVDSAASLITPIELEHTEWLGNTIGQIAFEKAGIIKPGKPCFLARQLPEAEEVFERVAAERGAPLWRLATEARVPGIALEPSGTRATISFNESGPWGEAQEYRCPLIGRVQGDNMALAMAAARVLEPGLSPEVARKGLLRASLPARFQILPGEPPVILDGAHTPASIRLALESFQALFPGPAHLLFACAHDKKHGEMAAILGGHFDRVTITRPGTFKQSHPAEVAASFGLAQGRCRLVEDHDEALALALGEARVARAPLLIAGSFYLCAAAEAFLAGPNTTPREKASR